MYVSAYFPKRDGDAVAQENTYHITRLGAWLFSVLVEASGIAVKTERL